MLLKHLLQLVNHLQIKLFKLSNSDTRTSPRIVLYLFNLNLLVYPPVVHLNIIENRKYLTQPSPVQHFVNTLSHHTQQLLLIRITHPKHYRIFHPQTISLLLVRITDSLSSNDNPLQKLSNSLLVVAVSLQCHRLVVLQQKLVFLLLRQPPHFFKLLLLLFSQLSVNRKPHLFVTLTVRILGVGTHLPVQHLQII